MALPEHEMMTWGMTVQMELTQTPAPYFGVNILDVRPENWDALLANARVQTEYAETLGGRLHLWAVRDHGDLKRVIWINYYPTVAAPDAEAIAADPRFASMWPDFCKLIENYRWFCATEQQPSDQP